jgi:hypothetical protein
MSVNRNVTVPVGSSATRFPRSLGRERAVSQESGVGVTECCRKDNEPVEVMGLLLNPAFGEQLRELTESVRPRRPR